MPVNSVDFYQSAKENLTIGNEIGYRNCVSRAYYGMYHEVLSIINEEIPSYATKGAHACLITYLAEGSSAEPYDSKELVKLSYILKQHRDNRFEADYELDSDAVDSLMAENSVKAFERIESICSGLRKAA